MEVDRCQLLVVSRVALTSLTNIKQVSAAPGRERHMVIGKTAIGSMTEAVWRVAQLGRSEDQVEDWGEDWGEEGLAIVVARPARSSVERR